MLLAPVAEEVGALSHRSADGGTRWRTQPVQQVLHVDADRAGRNAKPLRDFAIAESLRDETRHMSLACRQLDLSAAARATGRSNAPSRSERPTRVRRPR